MYPFSSHVHADRKLLNIFSLLILNVAGYRYELFCMSKAVPTRQVTVHCDVSDAQAWDWNCARPDNEKYKRLVKNHNLCPCSSGKDYAFKGFNEFYRLTASASQ